MATIDSNGVLFYQDTDSFTPPASLNLAQANLSSLIGNNTRFRRVANTTARDALVTSIGLANITPENPLLVWRADAADGLQLEYTTNGSTWRTLADKEYYDAQAAARDTGWVSVPLASGFTGSLYVRKHILGTTAQVSARGAISGSWTAGTTTTVATIPGGYRPAVTHPNPSIFSNGEFNWGNITSGGTVSSRKSTSGSSMLLIGTAWLT